MSNKLGPVNFGKKSEEIFLGREITQHRDYSENTAVIIDQEVKHIVETASQNAEILLKKNVKILHKLAEALLDREILDGEEIDCIISGKTLTPKNNKKKPADSTHKDTSPGKQKTKSRPIG